MIRIDTIWLAIEPMEIRAGIEAALALAVAVFGAAKPHCAYVLANRRANRMKVLVYDGVGIWIAARRLNQGSIFWLGVRHGSEAELDAEQLQRCSANLLSPAGKVSPRLRSIRCRDRSDQTAASPVDLPTV
ncbi:MULTISPECIES: IS66 family insertion sequence element accessory protein TnpB [unclassified Pseudomonas]|uniref:IS66 family insertion sequence element accessory protein TnpB n=1 Tax=unclassified Pseudomonas TaxID=196821 RepID=UPI0039B75E8B